MAAVVAPSQSRGYLDRRWIEVGVWAAMGLGLALCYLGQTQSVITAGLLLLGGLALLRPDLALLLIPLVAPLFLTPLIAPRSGRQIAVPPHELALLVSAAAALPQLVGRGVRFLKDSAVELRHIWSTRGTVNQTFDPDALTDDGRRKTKAADVLRRPSFAGFGTRLRSAARRPRAARYLPEALLLLAGVAGVCMAVPEPKARDDALRAFRWFVAEPLMFVALIRLHARWPAPGGSAEPQALARRLLYLFVLGGAAVALLGLFQLASYVQHAQSKPPTFATGAGVLGGMQRVTSVYGNPNNLALYLGRVWPVAAALAMTGLRTKNQEPRSIRFGSWFLVLGCLMCLAGIVISLSRGAWLGAGAALLVLALPAVRSKFGRRIWPVALMAGATVVAVGALIVALRGGPLGGSADVRILFWQESVRLLELRPLGLGLDQFFYYHNPAYGRSLINPALANTQERYAHQPHNLLFEIWFNLGPLGMLAFGLLLARSLRDLGGRLRSMAPANRLLARGLLAALAAALVHGMVDSFYFWPDIAIAFWLLIGVGELVGEPLSRRTREPKGRMTT